MFERFTDKARRAVVLAQEEARRYNHHCICAEHLLLALIDDENTAAHLAMAYLGADFEKLRADVVGRAGTGSTPPHGHIPFTVDAKRALEAAFRESIEQGVDHIAPEHLLLGILRAGNSVGNGVLVSAGITYEAVRAQVAQIIGAVFPGQSLTFHQVGDTVYPTREQAEAAAGDGEMVEVRVELRPGEAFAVANRETGMVWSNYSLDYGFMFGEAQAYAPSEVVVMQPVANDVYAADAAFRSVRIGATVEYVAVPLKLRTRPA